MPSNRVSAHFTAEEREGVKALVATINDKMPFLIDLSADERAAMPRFGDRSLAFIRNALSIAEAHPEILPASFSLDEFRADVEMIENLYVVRSAVETLLGRVRDTWFAAGSEAYASALLVYQYAKVHNVATGALEDALDDLGRRFARKLKKKKPAVV